MTFEALGKGVEILHALLSDRRYLMRGLFRQLLAAAAWVVGQAALFRKRLEVLFLHLNFRANVIPPTIARQVHARENPRLYFFPGVLAQEYERIVPKLLFDLIEPLPSSGFSIAIYTQYEDIYHPLIPLGYFRYAVGFQSLGYSSKQRILAHPDFR